MDEEGYGYNIVHLSTRADTGKWQITHMDESGEPTGHVGAATLPEALKESGKFRKDYADANSGQGEMFAARNKLKELGIEHGDYAYVSHYRPFGMWKPDKLKDAVTSDVGRKGIVFTKEPFSLGHQKELELTPTSFAAVHDSIHQKTERDFPLIGKWK